MLFNEYLKKCREKYSFTQEELVQELYSFSDIFEGLDVTTLSRWERNITRPNIDKQIGILKFFKTKSSYILSCFENLKKDAIEEELCKLGVKNLIGSSKEHILNGPTAFFNLSYASLKQIRNAVDIDKALAMPYSVILNLTNNVYDISLETLKEWALHPSSFFLYAEYHEQFAGMSFSLRLKPEVLDAVINFKKSFKDITIADFASFEEQGSHLSVAFFAHNEKIANLLAVRLYAHIIANQDVIQKIAVVTFLEGAKKIAQKMNLKFYQTSKYDQGIFESYCAPLDDVLLNEAVIKMLFQKQKCPEDE